MSPKALARAVGSSGTSTTSPACATNKLDDDSSPSASLPQDITHIGLSDNAITIQEFSGDFSGSEQPTPGFSQLNTSNALQLVVLIRYLSYWCDLDETDRRFISRERSTGAMSVEATIPTTAHVHGALGHTTLGQR